MKESILPRKEVKSVLDSYLQHLLNVICNVQMMERTMIELEYDATKSPLGNKFNQHNISLFILFRQQAGSITKGISYQLSLLNFIARLGFVRFEYCLIDFKYLLNGMIFCFQGK